MLRIRDITSSANLVIGLPIRTISVVIGGDGGNGAGTFVYGGSTATLKGRFTIAGTKTVRLQFYSSDTTMPCSNTLASDSGVSPVTAYVRFWKIA